MSHHHHRPSSRHTTRSEPADALRDEFPPEASEVREAEAQNTPPETSTPPTAPWSRPGPKLPDDYSDAFLAQIDEYLANSPPAPPASPASTNWLNDYLEIKGTRVRTQTVYTLPARVPLTGSAQPVPARSTVPLPNAPLRRGDVRVAAFAACLLVAVAVGLLLRSSQRPLRVPADPAPAQGANQTAARAPEWLTSDPPGSGAAAALPAVAPAGVGDGRSIDRPFNRERSARKQVLARRQALPARTTPPTTPDTSARDVTASTAEERLEREAVTRSEPSGVDASIPASVAATTPAEPSAIVPAVPQAADRQAIARLLNVYRQSYERLDAGAVAAVWRSVDSTALARNFDSVRSQQLTFDSCDLAMDSGAATARCRGVLRYVPRVGAPTAREQHATWVIDLSRADDRWLIERVRAQR